MQQALNKMIEEVNKKVEELNNNPLFAEIKKKKKFINEYSINWGGNIIYGDLESDAVINGGSINITPGQFKGSTLAKAVKWYLEARGKDNPPTYEEILEILTQGDYDGAVSDIKKAILKNNQISQLGTRTGVKRYGLTKWYYKKGKKINKSEEGDETENEEETQNHENSDEKEKAVE